MSRRRFTKLPLYNIITQALKRLFWLPTCVVCLASPILPTKSHCCSETMIWMKRVHQPHSLLNWDWESQLSTGNNKLWNENYFNDSRELFKSWSRLKLNWNEIKKLRFSWFTGWSHFQSPQSAIQPCQPAKPSTSGHSTTTTFFIPMSLWL